MKKQLWLLFIILFISVIAFGANESKIFITLTTDKQVYQPKDPIAMALTVCNSGSQSYQAIFSSGKKYDFFLNDANGKEVWKWSGDKLFSQAFSKMALEPGKPKTYVIVFDQVLPSGEKLKAGKYKLVGVLTKTEKEFKSEPVEIEVR